MPFDNSFAKSQLLKHGWKDGEGLGRTGQGIKDAIRPKIKQDTKGIGHNAAEEFTFQWWDHVFNKAANSIEVVNNEDGVSVSKTGEYNISHKKDRMAKTYTDKNLLYGRFVKAATLTNTGEEIKETPVNSDSSSDEEDREFKHEKLTDEELFKICGGRTAHKAARHGHRLNGKLARIAEQENKTVPEAVAEENSNHEQVKAKKNKKKKNKDLEDDSCHQPEQTLEVDKEIQSETSNIEELVTSKKHKKKKNQNKDLDEVCQTSEVVNGNCGDEEIQCEAPTKMKKKSKKSEKSPEKEVQEYILEEQTLESEKSKKRKKKRKQCDSELVNEDENSETKLTENTSIINDIDVKESDEPKRKKKKSKKDISITEDTANSNVELQANCDSSIKDTVRKTKKKRSKHNKE